MEMDAAARVEFGRRAQQIHDEFERQVRGREARPEPQPREPSTPEDVVWAAASALDADALGGVFRREEDDLIQVGFSRNADTYGAKLRATLPDVPLLVVTVRHANVRLLEIQDEIADLMSDDIMGDGIHSVGGHDHDDFLLVGVADPDADVARELTRRYGDAVAIFRDEPLELL